MTNEEIDKKIAALKEKDVKSSASKETVSKIVKRIIAIGVLGAIIVGIVWFISAVIKVDREDKLEKQAFKEKMADPANYEETTLQWVEQYGFYLDESALKKIPMVIWSYRPGEDCEVWNGSYLEKGTLKVHTTNENVRQQLKDLSYSKKAFYAYCEVTAGGLIFINFIDYK